MDQVVIDRKQYNHTWELTFTPNEVEELTRVADFHGVTVSAWLKQLARDNMHKPLTRMHVLLAPRDDL
jgi:hypothetical protein